MGEHSRRLYPLLFAPVLKDYVWGGRNLERLLGRELPAGRVAESWEIAAHKDGQSIVINGLFTGMTLTSVHKMLGLDLIGRRNAWAQERGKFPLLVKLLDAQDKLSVQVHPDDAYALAHEGNELGKTEMWVVLHAEPDAEIILGLRRGATKEKILQAIAEGTLERYLHSIPVRAGDFVCVPSRTLHAILGGVVIVEIQQSSNTTYRVYDWNRSNSGAARPLHVRQALDVINFELIEPSLPKLRVVFDSDGIKRSLLCQNQYFTTERVNLAPGAEFTGELNGDTLEIWGIIEGQVAVNEVEMKATKFTLLPAALGSYRVITASGATCLRTYVE
jgi:mannose-6-phosphate isomerase